MSRLSSLLDKRLASLTVIAVCVLAALFLVLETLSFWRADAASLVELERRTLMLEERASAISARGPDGRPADPLEGRVLIYGETPGLASAEFQRIVTTLAQKAGAAVRSLDVPEVEEVADIVDADGGRLYRIKINAELEVMEQALPDLLYAIETDMPAMIVDSLSLRTNRSVANVGGEMWSAAARPLSLRLTLSAFRSGKEG